MTYQDNNGWQQDHGYLQPTAPIATRTLTTPLILGVVAVLVIAAAGAFAWVRLNDRLDTSQHDLRALTTEQASTAAHLRATQQQLGRTTSQLRTLEKDTGTLKKQLTTEQADLKAAVAKLPADWRTIAAKDLPSVAEITCDTASDGFAGTGFAVAWPAPAPTGYTTALLTNAHVVEQCGPSGDGVASVEKNGRWYDAKVVGLAPINDDKAQDIALVYTSVALPTLTVNPTPPAQGDDVAAIGNPLEIQGVFTHGTVEKVWAEGWIQHQAAINHGSSGGPLIDQSGAVVGINTWGIDQDPNGDPVQGTFFAEPISSACVFVTTATCPFKG